MDSTYLEWHEPPRGIRGLSSLRRTARSAASEYVVWTGPAGGAASRGTSISGWQTAQRCSMRWPVHFGVLHEDGLVKTLSARTIGLFWHALKLGMCHGATAALEFAGAVRIPGDGTL
jgi:hypothetical protein